MKFKGIELRTGNDSEAELLVNVEITREFYDDDELDDFLDEVEEKIIDAFEEYPEDVYVECVADDLVQVRCDEITFDMNGVVLLTDIHRVVSGLNLEDTIVCIGVHVDGEEWFKREDGTEYNEDMVSLEEFLDNVEY